VAGVAIVTRVRLMCRVAAGIRGRSRAPGPQLGMVLVAVLGWVRRRRAAWGRRARFTGMRLMSLGMLHERPPAKRYAAAENAETEETLQWVLLEIRRTPSPCQRLLHPSS